MVGPTQLEIDTAVMVAKNATYKLAYELALERKYGGNIDCCVTKLKLLWLYKRALACQVEYTETTTLVDESTVSYTYRYDVKTQTSIYFNGLLVLAASEISFANLAAKLVTLSAALPTGVSVVSGTLTETTYQLVWTGTCSNGIITMSTDNGRGVVVNTDYDLAGGVCSASTNPNCLTNEKAKKLIAKINSMCNKN